MLTPGLKTMDTGLEPLRTVRVYRNSDILRIAAFIPPCHRHLRLVIVAKDQTIVLHEATVAAIVRAYTDIVLHPTKKAIEYSQVKLDKSVRKPGYAEHQFIEVDRDEQEVVMKWSAMLGFEQCQQQNDS